MGTRAQEEAEWFQVRFEDGSSERIRLTFTVEEAGQSGIMEGEKSRDLLCREFF